MSIRTIPSEDFELKMPRLSPLTRKAHDYQPDHALLVGGEGKAQLRVDLPLFRTLYDAQRGLPMALRSPDVVKRLDVFFNLLGREYRAKQDIEDVHIKNCQTGESIEFKVDRVGARYSR